MKQGTEGLSSTLLRVARVIATLCVLFGVMSVVGGSACYVTTCDDDWDDDDDDGDDDDDCYDDDDGGNDDDDDDGSTTALGRGDAQNDASDWVLREYQLLPALEQGAHPSQHPFWHPFRAVVAIRGFSLTSKLGPGIFGNDELQHFTSEVIAANDALFELPEGAGRLRFDAIDQQPDFIVVSWVQEIVDEREVATLVPDAALVFVFDLHGRLIEIDDTLRVVGGAAR